MKKQIINYSVDKDNNEIIIHYNDDTNYVREYTVAEEKKVLYEMKEQVLQNKDVYDYVKNLLNDDDKVVKRFMIAFCLSMGISVASIVAAIAISPWFFLGLFYAGNGVFLFNEFLNEALLDADSHRKFIKKYEKEIYLIEHSDVLSNEKILQPRALDGVSEQTQKYIISSNLDEHIPILNLNSIDEIPQEDLETINNNIEQPKVLKLK